MPRAATIFTVLTVLGLPGLASAADLWNEGTQGDLSDDRLNPSAFALPAGGSTLRGVLEGVSDDVVDRDYFSITIPQGFQLDSISLDAYTSTDFLAFIGLAPGAVFPFDPATVNADDLLGYALFGPFDVGGDLLAKIGQNGQGFTAPLAAGTYTFWAQQTGDFTEYTATFNVSAVPAPGVLSLVGITAVGLVRRRR